MVRLPHRRMNRLFGVATSIILLGLIFGSIGLQSARVRGHIPYLNAPAPTPKPAGVVLRLDQLPAPDVANAAAPVVSTPEPTAQTVAAVVETPAATEAPTATIAPTILPVSSATVAATSTPAPTVAPTATAVPATPTTAPTPQPQAIPPAVFLEPMDHWYQTWNNCAGVTTAMTLSYFGIKADPLVLSPIFRPNANDKHVESYQVTEYLHTQGLKAETYEGGTVDRIKRLIAVGAPVIVAQWQNRTDHAGIGHYRVVRGYDDAKGAFLMNDSMEGPSVAIKYTEFDDLWSLYDYRYIPVWNDKLDPAVRRVLGDDMDPKVNLPRAIRYMQGRIEQQPGNAELWFGLGGGYFRMGDYQKAVDNYHKAVSLGLMKKTPWTIWYQFWPVTALVNVGLDDEALATAQENINSAKAFGEMHYERGRVFEKRGDMTTAKREYQMALVDDKNFKDAQKAVARLGG